MLIITQCFGRQHHCHHHDTLGNYATNVWCCITLQLIWMSWHGLETPALWCVWYKDHLICQGWRSCGIEEDCQQFWLKMKAFVAKWVHLWAASAHSNPPLTVQPLSVQIFGHILYHEDKQVNSNCLHLFLMWNLSIVLFSNRSYYVDPIHFQVDCPFEPLEHATEANWHAEIRHSNAGEYWSHQGDCKGQTWTLQKKE